MYYSKWIFMSSGERPKRVSIILEVSILLSSVPSEVRMQADGSHSAWSAARTAYKEAGVLAFARGFAPAALRGMLLTVRSAFLLWTVRVESDRGYGHRQFHVRK